MVHSSWSWWWVLGRSWRHGSLAVACAGFLAACPTFPGGVPLTVPITGSDASSFAGNLRASFPLVSPVAEEGERPSRFPAGKFLDVQLAHTDGSFGQQVGAVQAVELGSVVFVGPDALVVDVAQSALSVGGRSVKPLGRGFGVEASAGLEFGRLEVDVVSATKSATEEIDSYGIAYGLTLTHEPLPWLQLRGGFDGVFGLAEGGDDYASAILGLGLVFALNDDVRLAGGWRRTDIDVERESDDPSGLQIDLAGPWLGLWIAF